MVATVVAFVALLVAITVPMLYVTWVSLREETHSPSPGGESSPED